MCHKIHVPTDYQLHMFYSYRTHCLHQNPLSSYKLIFLRIHTVYLGLYVFPFFISAVAWDNILPFFILRV